MKQLICVAFAIGLLCSALAQTPRVEITTGKTTSLIFPFPVKHVDRGTRDILVQQVKEAGHILLVKAAAPDFSETNLSIVTSDGSLYSLTVNYKEKPASLVVYLPPASSPSLPAYANNILDNPPAMRGPKYRAGLVVAALSGIYIKDSTVYYQLHLKNESPIDYDIDFLRFYTRDKKKAKRTAIQESELRPLLVAGNPSQVKANTVTSLVVAFEKFTLPDAQYLGVEIAEKNGGRHLVLKIPNRKIMQAIPLPDRR